MEGPFQEIKMSRSHNHKAMFVSKAEDIKTRRRQGVENIQTHFCPACPKSFLSDEGFKLHWKQNHVRTLDKGRNHGI
jgi:hypothetical protein